MKMTKSIFVFMSMASVAVLSSCSDKNHEIDKDFTLTNGEMIKIQTYIPKPGDPRDSSRNAAPIFGGKAKPKLVTEDLPGDYTKRKFLQSSGAYIYNLGGLPGNILKYNPTDSSYTVITSKNILKNNFQPIPEAIKDGVFYNSKIDDKVAFNGSAIIANVSASSQQIVELIIEDVLIASVPDSVIDGTKIASAKALIPAADLDKCFFVKYAVLTNILNKKHEKTEFNIGVNTTYVTAAGSAYSSNDLFKKQRMISVELVPLKDIIDIGD